MLGQTGFHAATIASLSLERQAFFRQPWQADFRRTDHLTKLARGGSDTAPREPVTEQNTVHRFVEVMSKGRHEEVAPNGKVVFRKSDGSTELIDALDRAPLETRFCRFKR